MSKVQEYLEKKRITALGLPKVWYVHSHCDTGVHEPVEVQVTEITNGGTRYYSGDNSAVKLYKYRLEGKPYSAVFAEGKQFSIETQYGSGFGDLWCYTEYVSFSKEDAFAYYEKEKKRLEKKPLLKAIEVLTEAKPFHEILNKFAREKYAEKFNDTKTPYNAFHNYSGFKILSENSLSVEFKYGAGDMEFDDSFTVTID